VRHSAHSAHSASRRRRASRAAAPAAGTTAAAPTAAAPTAAAPTAAGRPAAGRLPRLRHLPYVVILCALALTLAWIRQSGQNVKGGTLAVAGILFVAALARLALPERRAGLLVSRRRLADVAVLAALGVGLLVAGLVLPAQA
jgi:hypothetical protein